MENKVIDKFEEYCNLLDEGCPVILLTALKLLKEQPEIVRCKDCKWGHIKGNGKYTCSFLNGWHSGDWFCADGVRKEG